jgi:hypothetical protein
MQNNYFQPGMAKVSAAAALGAEKTDLNNSQNKIHLDPRGRFIDGTTHVVNHLRSCKG